MEKDHNYIVNHLTSEKIKNIYFGEQYNLDYEVRSYLIMLNNFYKSENPLYLKSIQETSFRLLPKLNHAVNIFESESDMKTQELLKRQQFILIGTLLTLLFEALFIVIPSIRFARKKRKSFKN